MPRPPSPATARRPADPPVDLAGLQRYVKDVQVMLQEQEIPDTPECHAARDRVREAARELWERATSPVTIGVVGEYTVGKSLLLGTLLGCPDLLPVEERATTGNITVLSLKAGEPGAPTTAAEEVEVRYLTEAQLSRCVRDILSSLVAGLDERHPALGTGKALAGYDPVTDPGGWARFDGWYPCLWPAPPGTAPRPVPPETVGDTYRDTVEELCRIRDALLSQQREGVLGQRVTVKRAIAGQALELPTERLTPAAPPKPVLQPFDRESVRTDPGALGQSFPLIERVVQEVTVSPDHWPLGGLLTEHPVQLLDFPGIGAAGSYGRDKSLSRRALVDVHTILLVILATRPQSKGASEFWDMLLEDGRTPEALAHAALVAANAFDRAHLPSLASVPGPGLPMLQLLRHADELNGIHVHGDKYVRGRQDRVVVTSPVPAIRRYELSYTALGEETRNRVRKAIGVLPPAGTRPWEHIAARLEETEPANPWTPRLRAYDEDGGIDRLRSLIEDHVRRNGVAQKLERAEASRRRLDAALLTLRRQVHRATAGDSAVHREIVERFAELRRLLDHQVRPALHAVRDPGPPAAGDAAGAEAHGRTGAPDAPPPGLAAAADAVHRDVFRWTQWHHLLERADRDPRHLVTKSRPPVTEPAEQVDLPPGYDFDTTADAPSDDEPAEDGSEVFVDNFVQTVQQWSRNGTDQLREWCQDWADHWQQEFAPLREWFADPGTAAVLRELYVRRFGDAAKARARLTHLWNGLVPAKAVEKLMPALDHRTWDTAELEQCFPAQPRHALPWHHVMRDLEEYLEERERHPLRVVELRQHTAVAAARAVTDHLGGLLGAVAENLVPLYDRASAALLQESDIVPPPRNNPPEGPAGGSPDGAGGPHGPTEPAGPPDGAAHVEQPIDRLVQAWSVD
ncbi:hypothetical protein [Streptomyces fungicidicus]|uniref:hypothetical protein n=1 Tax=Streptomyces fungicidicus TaxID=68203 RepID=UPI0038163714